MSGEIKLDVQHRHVLILIDRDKKEDGWTFVSEQLYKVLSENMPPRLSVFEKLEDGGRARLTEEGKTVLNVMVWL